MAHTEPECDYHRVGSAFRTNEAVKNHLDTVRIRAWRIQDEDTRKAVLYLADVVHCLLERTQPPVARG